MTQISTVSRKAWWRVSPPPRSPAVAWASAAPAASVRKAAITMPNQFGWPSVKSTNAGSSMLAPSATLSRPMMFPTGSKRCVEP